MAVGGAADLVRNGDAAESRERLSVIVIDAEVISSFLKTVADGLFFRGCSSCSQNAPNSSTARIWNLSTIPQV